MRYFLWIFAFFQCALYAQERPQLFFREDFKETPAEIPVSQKHINNAEVVIELFGEDSGQLKKSHHDTPKDDPYYVWSGLCRSTWAVTLKHRSKFVDLSKFGKIKWRSKQSGFRQLHIVLKLADGSWLVSDVSDGPSTDWRIREFNISDIKWKALDMKLIAETKAVKKPDLTKVEAIGWTDLMTGGNSDACSRLDWVEVYGYPIEE
ncbi:hypothetical protein [Flagellimonas onchidii]|uniref:hypothetical protein n=1 Tax=Flagellimonas onchidii TaxID=2562684 RepID=UPI0010A5F7E5|nr:hypothetical protein [Allomuricauda onchidii]